MDLIQSWYGDRYYCTVHFDFSLYDFDLAWFKVTEVQESKKPLQ